GASCRHPLQGPAPDVGLPMPQQLTSVPRARLLDLLSWRTQSVAQNERAAALRGRTREDLGSCVIGVPGRLASPSCEGTAIVLGTTSRGAPALLAFEA